MKLFIHTVLNWNDYNFTKDSKGNIWIAFYDPLDHQRFYLTQFQYGKKEKHYTFSGYGFVNGILFDHKIQSL